MPTLQEVKQWLQEAYDEVMDGLTELPESDDDELKFED